MAVLYETRRFDYNKLSEILILEAKFFQNILTQLRPEPEYFRVGFYGLGFPLFVRVSSFAIFRLNSFIHCLYIYSILEQTICLSWSRI